MRFLLVLLAACATTATPGSILRDQYGAKDPYCYPLGENTWDCFDSGMSYSCIDTGGRWTCHVRGPEVR